MPFASLHAITTQITTQKAEMKQTQTHVCVLCTFVYVNVYLVCIYEWSTRVVTRIEEGKGGFFNGRHVVR